MSANKIIKKLLTNYYLCFHLCFQPMSQIPLPSLYYVPEALKTKDFPYFCKADIRNLLSLLAHERSRFANCQWELLTPTDISIPLTHRLVLYTLEAGDCLFCVQICQLCIFCFSSLDKLFSLPDYLNNIMVKRSKSCSCLHDWAFELGTRKI